MNVKYLRRMILEQIDRTKSIKDAIPSNPRHAALMHLATACGDTLDDQAGRLEQCHTLLDSGDKVYAAMILKEVKRCVRAIGEVEGYGLPPLHCQSEQAVFLKDVLSAMHHETGLRFRCPAVSCTSNDYYFTHLPTNTVYVPLSEATFLLHMPDFYHELGHVLLDHADHKSEYGPIKAGLASAVGATNGYYSQQVNSAGREAVPAQAQDGTEWVRTQWSGSWIQEAFCDLFALFAVGPAYAYSNLHLVSKLDRNVYELNILARQDHPSGEARMRLLDAGMRLLGNEQEADHVREEWDAVAQLCGSPPPEYGHAFPSCLLHSIAATILPTFGQAGLRGYAEGRNVQGVTDEVAVATLLNDAWRTFWRVRDAGFRDLEKPMVAKLASIARGHCDAV